MIGLTTSNTEEDIMSDVINFEQEKINKEELTLEDIVTSFTSNNCDTNRPYLEQQPKRAQMEIKGLTRRDICDCMVLGILECKDPDKYKELPRIYISDKGAKFNCFDDLLNSDEGYGYSFIDPERVTYNDLYDWNLDDIDPVAAVQNMALHLERRMGVYPALLDGELKVSDPTDI